MKPATDGEYEAADSELFIHTLAIRVEYYRSFEYCLKWKRHMYPRRSSRLQKASRKSPQGSFSPDEEVIQRRLKSKRLRKAEGDNNLVRADEWRDRDIIDIINSTHNAQCVAQKDEGKFVEVADKGVDESDEDCCSVTSSIASGPSALYRREENKPGSSRALCSSCWRLYQKAKKMKAPIKNKLFDNDPKSLTCDQWVLLKDWRPRRLPHVKGKLLTQIQLVAKRRKVKKSTKQTEQCVEEGEPSSCSRPHTFLQRNLRRCVTVSMKKETRKTSAKRRRKGSQGSRAAKQQRLHSNNRHQHTSNVRTDNDTLQPAGSGSSSPGLDGCSDHEMDSSEDEHLTFEVIPSTIILETTEPRKVPAKQKSPKKTGGFRDLLAQLRSNSSMIVRETS